MVTGNSEETQPPSYFFIIWDFPCCRVYQSCINGRAGTGNYSTSESFIGCSGTYVRTAGIPPERHIAAVQPSRKCGYNRNDYADRVR
jgi:hypothetical protein